MPKKSIKSYNKQVKKPTYVTKKQPTAKSDLQHQYHFETISDSSPNTIDPDEIATSKEISVVSVPKLGERLLEMGLINQAQFEYALEFQRSNGGRLGDILVSLEFINKFDFEKIILPERQNLTLGKMLLNEGVITPEQMNRALEFQKKSGGLLGDVLLTMGMVSAEIVYRCLATQNQLGRVGNKFDINEAQKLPFSIVKKYQACIINRQSNRYIVAVVSMLRNEQLQEIESFLDMPVEQVLADQHEIDSYWGIAYGIDQTDESINKLLLEMPENSAMQTFTLSQRIFFAAFCVTTLIGFILSLKLTFLVLNALIQCLYLAIASFKMYILIRGANSDSQIRISDEELRSLDEKELPIYTILIPIYKEKEVIYKLLNNIDQMEYPKAKLDVRLLLEEDDHETIAVIGSYNLPYYCTVIIVPNSFPKTKPKACNYGLIRARGEYVVVYDAEDRPEPNQLKIAYLAFKRLPEHYVCVQAKLNYYNSNQNILTKWFTLEYSMWFELLLPGVVQLKIPVPLGGTSNHFKTQCLKQVGAWDPYNVTEDADLGVRLFKEGYVTAVIDSRTWEEANSRLKNWIRQRSRWIKGYMQTWLVHMRNPVKLFKEVGLSGFLGFQAIIMGSVLLPLVNPILWSLLILWYTTKAHWITELFPGPLYYSAALLLVVGNFFFVYSNSVGMYWVINAIEKTNEKTSFSYGLVKYSLISPLYWMMMSIAAFKALWQLIVNPFHWEKTHHGLGQEDHPTTLQQ